MHSHSHPETDERTRPDAPQTPAPTSQVDAEHAELHRRFAEAVDADGLTLHKVGLALGYSPSVVSQYLKDGRYPGDLKKLRRRVAEWLQKRESRRLVGVKLVHTDVSQAIATALEVIRQTNDVGVIYGDAGIGKTSGILLYLDDNPLSVVVTLNRWTRTADAIEAAVLQRIEHGAWKRGMARGNFIVERLRDSNRLLIVDNAHKATRSGLEWLFDLHDETRIPIALVGNEEVLREIEANDQRFSRVGLKQPITSGRGKALLRHLTQQIAPAFVGKVEDLLEQVSDQHGRFRAVAKQLSLAGKLADAGMEPVAAVRSAHTRLVRHYQLA